MRLAYISFEYPPDTAVGGIATYVNQVARMMKSRGHDVEVFCASPTRAVTEEYEGLLVHRIHTNDTAAFPKLVLPIFEQRHQEKKFDLMESPEYKGDGYEIKRRFPEFPLVVKLHTPTRFIIEVNNTYSFRDLNRYDKARYIFGGLVRGELRQLYWRGYAWKKGSTDIESQITLLADQIHTPSISLGEIVSQKWGIPRKRIFDVPYPFIPNEQFLNIPIVSTSTKRVTFIGRLETRKGLVELTKAIPYVCQAVPEATFRFVGKPVWSIVPGMNMDEYIKVNLPDYQNRLEFTQATATEIPGILAETDVCVFPSIWENFPNVCLESMSAGRAIVGSNQGGMNDMLSSPQAGLLVDPLQPREIADAIIKLLIDAELRVQLGKVARQKVLEAYNKEKIGDLMEGYYKQLL